MNREDKIEYCRKESSDLGTFVIFEEDGDDEKQ